MGARFISRNRKVVGISVFFVFDLCVLVSQGDTACSRRYGNLLYLLIDECLTS
jgi:hypothetical protein